MKVFSKTYLPHTIDYNGETYTYAGSVSGSSTVSEFEERVKELKLSGHKVIMCNVLASKLRGVEDLHGNLYKPTQWLFVHKKE